MTNEQKEQLQTYLKDCADKGKLEPGQLEKIHCWLNSTVLDEARHAETSQVYDAAFKITPQDVELHFNRLESDPEYAAKVLADLQNSD